MGRLARQIRAEYLQPGAMDKSKKSTATAYGHIRGISVDEVAAAMTVTTGEPLNVIKRFLLEGLSAQKRLIAKMPKRKPSLASSTE